VAKRWDRAFGRRTMAPPPGLWLDEFAGAMASRFFVGAASETTPALITRDLGAHYDDTLAVAEAIVRRRFDLLGHAASTTAIPSTGISIRSPGGARPPCTGAASTRSTPPPSATARWCGS